MKAEIKALRINIDGLAQLTKELKPIKIKKVTEYNPDGHSITWIPIKEFGESFSANTKEIENATDSLYLAKAWLGKILGELGSDTPYKNDGNRKNIEDIENATDKHRGIEHLSTNGNWNTDYNHIQKIDFLREQIKIFISDSNDFSEKYPEIELEQGFVYKYLCEARFWLGFELERIKNAN